MKRSMTLLAVGIFAAAATLFAQNPKPGPPQGRGQGNAPHAYCDKNGDGLCDVTGLPVGQCQGSCRRGNGPGNGPHAYGDQDGDGLCDRTGLPVGQGRQGAGRGQGRGLRAGAPQK